VVSGPQGSKSNRRSPPIASIGVTIDHRLTNRQSEPELLRVLALAQKEIEVGKGYDLTTVLAQADFLLNEMRQENAFRGFGTQAP